MSDATLGTAISLRSLGKKEWIEKVAEHVEDKGALQHLGKRHWSIFTEGDGTLLVTFETFQGIQTLSPEARPLGWDISAAQGWSHLALISDGDTWFRDGAVYADFDRRVDDAFFDGFDRVVFYGAGPCGYAATAYSVVAPGGRVLAIQPQATLDPRLAGWDTRFVEQRRLNFTDRYGYAPDMLEAAGRAYIVFDPYSPEDAMHAALFARPNVSLLRIPNMGTALQTDLLAMGVLQDLVTAAAQGRLTSARFARLMRARRDHLPYLRRLLNRLERDEREELIRLLCHNVSARMRAPRFARRLKTVTS